ncbi:hypothetical protein [Psychromonas arctica]|uniref:hypothetical protein n=1 Tax=Psychromonas arctica TaxID=168275 RepID=UPI0012EC90A3|nr:hypothetical protein [Psychromonas arctica]
MLKNILPQNRIFSIPLIRKLTAALITKKVAFITLNRSYFSILIFVFFSASMRAASQSCTIFSNAVLNNVFYTLFFSYIRSVISIHNRLNSG